jgi:hypothetical protein
MPVLPELQALLVLSVHKGRKATRGLAGRPVLLDRKGLKEIKGPKVRRARLALKVQPVQ